MATGDRHINAAGMALIEHFESFQPEAYTCPAGKLTIGFGHVIKEHESFDFPISLHEARKIMQADLSNFERGVSRLVGVEISDNMFSALVSFAYNLGLGALERSTLLRRLNAGDTADAANEFQRWDKATVGGVKKQLPGLVARRKAEKELFLTPD